MNEKEYKKIINFLAIVVSILAITVVGIFSWSIFTIEKLLGVV